MKHVLRICLFTLLMALATPCFALMEIAWVTPKEAKELGIDLRIAESGPDAVRVELQFKPEGQFKDFQHVSLEIAEGGKDLLGYAPLKEKRSESGKITVGFWVARSYLDKITLRIVAGTGLSYSGHDLRLKEFIKPENAR
ncbi:MAG: hypothetical protein K0Q55_2999 [Verrucomicrobia bacterium]|jgi:hypothetical protein|nr:hypothetical protein [Verrucomicrobiota bacterium]